MAHISCITCPRDLPDMYTHALGPNGFLSLGVHMSLGVHIRQITRVLDTTITCSLL